MQVADLPGAAFDRIVSPTFGAWQAFLRELLDATRCDAQRFQGEWEDPEFLRPQEAKGELQELQDEDAKTVNLKVIEKKSVGAE